MIINKISISKKITGSMISLLFIMLMIVVVSFFKIEHTDKKLTTMTTYVIPLSSSVHIIYINSLKQKNILERLLKFSKLNKIDIKLIDKELDNFKIITQRNYNEFNNSKILLNKAIGEIDINDNAIELMQIVPLLKIIEKEYKDFNNLVLDITNLENIHKIETFSEYLKEVTQEIDELDYILLETVDIFQKLMQNESQDVMIGELKIHELSLIISLLAFSIGIMIAPKLSKNIVSPLKTMIIAAKAISSGNLDIQIKTSSNDEVGELANTFNDMTQDLKKQKQIKETFGKYVDPRVVEDILLNDNDLEITNGNKKNMTIFFSDIENFTTISELLTPSGLITLMNRYFTLTSKPITNYNGVIDKYIGDAIMAFWGEPFIEDKNHAKLACHAALEQFDKLEELNADIAELLGFRKNLPKINIRIGLCSGEVIAGSIGSSNSKSYTVMGDTVNIASRLESANKKYGTRILISEVTYDMVKDEFITRIIDKITVAGKSEPTSIYELIGENNKVEKPVIELASLYSQAFDLYQQTNWNDANELLEQCLKINPQDKASQHLLNRINHFKSTPPPKDWNGIWHVSHK